VSGRRWWDFLPRHFGAFRSHNIFAVHRVHGRAKRPDAATNQCVSSSSGRPSESLTVSPTALGSVDATDPTVTSFNFTCPSVSPPAPIYFIQISSPYTTNITWTTRFAIADVNGQTVPAPTPTQPPGDYGSAGQPTPWGSATLTGPTQPAPSDVGASVGMAPSSAPANGASSASNALTNSASATPGMTSGSNSNAGTPTTGSAAPSGTGHNGAAGVGAVSFLTLGTVAMFIALVI
jgi:hypothetical protein